MFEKKCLDFLSNDPIYYDLVPIGCIGVEVRAREKEDQEWEGGGEWLAHFFEKQKQRKRVNGDTKKELERYQVDPQLVKHILKQKDGNFKMCWNAKEKKEQRVR